MLDYTLYLWHVLVHRVLFLWRFHAVHHVDLDLDAPTALRIGASPLALSVWQTLLLVEILFHYSSAELPLAVERWLRAFVVTPRLHAIHHSIVEEETNSNWSSGLTIWDRLHGTLRLDVLQDKIEIGVPTHRDPAEVTLPKLVAMPFVEQRPSWQLTGAGRRSDRFYRICPTNHFPSRPWLCLFGPKNQAAYCQAIAILLHSA